MSDDAPFVLLMPEEIEAALYTDGGTIVVERRPGCKVKRYLHFLDEDERRERRDRRAATNADVAYLDRLERARKTLLDDTELGQVLEHTDPTTWPSPESIARAASLRSMSLAAEDIQKAAELHDRECRLPGMYMLGPKALDSSDGFAGVRIFQVGAHAGGGFALREAEDNQGKAMVAPDVLEVERPSAAPYDIEGILALPLSAGMVNALVTGVLSSPPLVPPSAPDWKKLVDRHRTALSSGRNGVMFGVHDVLAMFPLLKPKFLGKALSMASTTAAPRARCRLRTGLFVTVLTVSRFLVVYQEPKIAGLKSSVTTKIRQMPELTESELRAFIEFTGSTSFATVASEQMTFVIASSTTERAENAVERVLSATHEGVVAGETKYLSDTLWLQEVRVINNKYLVAHGHRCAQQLPIDESLMLKLESTAMESSPEMSDERLQALGGSGGQQASSSLGNAGAVAAALKSALVNELQLKPMKLQELLSARGVLEIFNGDKKRAQKEVPLVLKTIASVDANQRFALR